MSDRCEHFPPDDLLPVDGDKLPFTGFGAIPVLIGGLALLSSGFVLRGRSARE